MDFPPYDETFEEFERRTGLNQYFGEFSSEVRSKLLYKNLERPTDVYDVLYPQTKKELLSKNVPIKHDLNKESEEIRNRLISKHVSDQVSLEESGESQRKAQIAKNKLLSSSIGLEELGEKARKNAVAKNKAIGDTLDKIANINRSNNLSRNSQKSSDLLEDSITEREVNINRNFVDDLDPYNEKQDLDFTTERANNLAKNSEKNTDLERDSRQVRKDNLSKNPANTSDLLSSSESVRNNDIAKNTPKDTDLERDSESYRNNDIAKNSPKDEEFTNLETLGASARADQLSRNYSRERDLETQSQFTRQEQLSQNSDKVSDLETDSAGTRADNLNKNPENNTDLELSSNSYREDNLSRNPETNTDLERLGASFRADDLSANKTSENDLETDSVPHRESDLSFNTPKNTDLEFDSQTFREEDLQNNVSSPSDLEFDSIVYRDSDLSANETITTDLETDSAPYRADDLSFNIPINSDLETDSVPYRDSDLSYNTPIETDLETDSLPYRDDDLSFNIPINSDLETDSIPYLGDNLSNNVPIDSDLAVDSVPYRIDDLASNATTGEFDLGLESIQHRNDDLAANTPIDTDLIGVSNAERNEQLAHNVSNTSDLGVISNPFRNDQLAKNPSRFSLGANINLVNTSFFVGISNLEIQGAIFREANKLLNRSLNKDEIPAVFDDEESIKFFEETAANADIPGGREILTQRNLNSALANIEGIGNINEVYSTRLSDDTAKPDDGITIFTRPVNTGYITNLISLHNIQQNTFQRRPGFDFNLGKQTAIEDLRGFGSDGFQTLLTLTGVDKRLQERTSTTPSEIIDANNGGYLGDDAEKILKEIQDEPLGSGLSMAAQSNLTDKIALDFDKSGPRSRGVRHVIDNIRTDDRIEFAQNFNVQGEKEQTSIFIIGSNRDGTLKKSYNRFSIKNPYAPDNALDMEFSLTNYSIGNTVDRTMAFPAYIESFQHGDSASWNETTFLGRPEPIYTYGNSTRDGSVTFVVLTDYAAEVDIGYSFDPDSGEVSKITEDFEGINHAPATDQDLRARSDIDAEIKELEEQLQELNANIEENADPNGQAGGNPEQLQQSEAIKAQIANLEREREDRYNSALINAQHRTFKENTKEGLNIYRFMEGFQENEIQGDFVESKAEDTVAKLSEMKEGLMFQPAYFSGSKADFVDRMEFISKLTRPARNTTIEDGFSFTRPPVCHIHIGDWFNHDIIINSVSYDYGDVPWTLDGGKVYPMWCKVTISFNIIGSYGARRSEDPPLSTDKGGFFGRFRK